MTTERLHHYFRNSLLQWDRRQRLPDVVVFSTLAQNLAYLCGCDSVSAMTAQVLESLARHDKRPGCDSSEWEECISDGIGEVLFVKWYMQRTVGDMSFAGIRVGGQGEVFLLLPGSLIGSALGAVFKIVLDCEPVGLGSLVAVPEPVFVGPEDPVRTICASPVLRDRNTARLVWAQEAVQTSVFGGDVRRCLAFAHR